MEGGGVPREWVISRICEEFHCLPSDAEKEDADTVFNIIELRSYARAKSVTEQPEADEDTLRRAGISEAMITAVFENIGRASRG